MRMTRRQLSRSIASVALSFAAVASTAVFGGTASAQQGPKVYTWNNDIHQGDCTMFRGARWVLKTDGEAIFTGKVTSGDDDDAWLMWAELKGANGQYLGNILAHQYDSDLAKFVINMPDSSQQYDWWVHGTFDPALLPRVESMSLRSHC